MADVWLQGLNVFFFAFHSLVVLFNVFGWLVPRWRRWHLVVVLLTACSWFVLGIWYGWGYCLCTDWHWQVREQLSYSNTSDSYIHFLLTTLTPLDLPPSIVDTVTVVVFFAVFAISVYLNLRRWMTEKQG